MSAAKRRIRSFPFHLILIGVALGYLARLVHPPETEVVAPRVLLPTTENMESPEAPEAFTDLPLLK